MSYIPPTVTIKKMDGQTIFFGVSVLKQEDQQYCVSAQLAMQQAFQQASYVILQVARDGVLCQDIRWKRYNAREQVIAKKRQEIQTLIEAGLDERDSRLKSERALLFRFTQDQIDEFKSLQSIRALEKEELFYLRGDYSSVVADGQEFSTNLYWAGSYSFVSKSGDQKTVRSFTSTLDAAVGFFNSSSGRNVNARDEAAPEPREIMFLRKSAESGSALAQVDMGVHFSKGDGVPKDLTQAYRWFSMAADQGNSEAVKQLHALERNMSSDQIAQAEKLAGIRKPQAATSEKRNNEYATSSGTGFLISEDGYVVTNFHVIKDSKKVTISTAQDVFQAKIVKTDSNNDLALVKIEGHFAMLPVSASRGVKLGDTVSTVGFPNPAMQGFSPKLSKGEIASLSGIEDDARYFQISAPLQPGNSGGALVDDHGNVVGVVSAKLSAKAAFAMTGALPENVNYAIKSSYLLGLLESVPGLLEKLKPVRTQDAKFSEVVQLVEQSTVFIIVE